MNNLSKQTINLPITTSCGLIYVEVIYNHEKGETSKQGR